MLLDSKIPSGPISESWNKTKFDLKLVAPNNKRKFEIIVVGAGLAGASAAATSDRSAANGHNQRTKGRATTPAVTKNRKMPLTPSFADSAGSSRASTDPASRIRNRRMLKLRAVR